MPQRHEDTKRTVQKLSNHFKIGVIESQKNKHAQERDRVDQNGCWGTVKLSKPANNQ